MISPILRFSLLSLMFTMSFHRVRGHHFLPQHPFNLKLCNDSAQYYTETNQAQKARKWINYALQFAGETTKTEKARTYLLSGDLEEAEGFALHSLTAYHQSRTFARQCAANVMEGSATNGIAKTLLALGRYDSVLFYLRESIRLDSSRKNQLVNQLVMAQYWQSQNQHDKSLSYFKQALDQAKELKDRKRIALALSGIGSIYFSQEPDMSRTLQYLESANAYCDSSKDANIIARNYARMANAYMVLGKTKEAENYLMRAKKITDLSGNLPVRGYVLSSWAILQAEKGDFATAVKFAEEPIRIKRQLGQIKQLQNDLLNISEWYVLLKNYDAAREMLNEGIATGKILNDAVYLQYFYEQSSQLDSLTGHYQSAYSNLKRSLTYKDSAVSLQRIKAVEEIVGKYEAEQKEKTIAEKEVVIQRQKYQQAVIIGISAIAVLILGIIPVVIRNRHKIKLEIEKQRQNHLRLQTIVHTQEEVQQSIARDLHDGLVQVLGAAKMTLAAINFNGDEKIVRDRVREASKIIDEACLEARQVSHQIIPYSLMKDGLIPALDELLKKNLETCEFRHPDELIRLASDIEINLYRIAQELVNNVVKHAEATHVWVELTVAPERLTFAFRDNGKGFDTNTQRQGVGLTNIMTRVELIGGIAEISSNPGKGTSLQLSVPL